MLEARSSYLLSFILAHLTGQLYPAQPADVLGDPTIQRLGNFLPVFRCLEIALIPGIADERDLRQDRWHIGPNQHNKGRLFHAPIPNAGIARSQSTMESCLHIA